MIWRHERHAEEVFAFELGGNALEPGMPSLPQGDNNTQVRNHWYCEPHIHEECLQIEHINLAACSHPLEVMDLHAIRRGHWTDSV